MNKAAFLDRDGVINVDKGYVFRETDLEWMPGAIEGMRKLQDMGYQLIVVTNQSGIARGYYTEDDFHRLSQFMIESLAHAGVTVAGIYFCPHHPNGSVERYTRICDCRKPAAGLILRAVKALNIDPAQSLMVGDKASDMQAARTAGITLLYHLTQASLFPGAVEVSSILDVAQKQRLGQNVRAQN